MSTLATTTINVQDDTGLFYLQITDKEGKCSWYEVPAETNHRGKYIPNTIGNYIQELTGYTVRSFYEEPSEEMLKGGMIQDSSEFLYFLGECAFNFY
jgi:hypothetical protein